MIQESVKRKKKIKEKRDEALLIIRKNRILRTNERNNLSEYEMKTNKIFTKGVINSIFDAPSSRRIFDKKIGEATPSIARK